VAWSNSTHNAYSRKVLGIDDTGNARSKAVRKLLNNQEEYNII
jgi:hypothetical protein